MKYKVRLAHDVTEHCDVVVEAASASEAEQLAVALESEDRLDVVWHFSEGNESGCFALTADETSEPLTPIAGA